MKKVLVVDDSKAIRQSIKFVLEQNEFEVVEACDGMDGIDKLSSGPVDLIISDVNMPNLDGIGFIKKVRENAAYKFIRILVLTTESQ